MSLRLRVLNLVLLFCVKPHLRRTKDQEKAALEFERAARLFFRVPPFLCHLTTTEGSLRLHWIRSGQPAARRVILYLHGGAYFVGSGWSYAPMLGRLSRLAGVEVCAVDYRLIQEKPFPAAFDDAVSAWQALIAKGYEPSDIILGGDSAGGGLALALLAHLDTLGCQPAGLFTMSPWTDLTLSGNSLRDLGPDDIVLPVERMGETVDQYLVGADPHDPRASPLFADFTTPPPVLIHVGSTEALLDDSYRMAERLRQSGGHVTLRTWDNAPHVWHLGDGWYPEARAALVDIAGFVQTCFGGARR